MNACLKEREREREWNGMEKGESSSIDGMNELRNGYLIENIEKFLPLSSIFFPDDNIISSIIVQFICTKNDQR